MEKKMPVLAFWMMAHIGIPIRNLFMPPESVFNEVEINPGDHVLDLGCGTGIYTTLVARETGPTGKVYAVDIHPLALGSTEKKAGKHSLDNIDFILSDCQLPIPSSTVDAVILFDVYHLLNNKKMVLSEIFRVLKPGAKLFFSDHHMKPEQILKSLNENGLFHLEGSGKYVYKFRKVCSYSKDIVL